MVLPTRDGIVTERIDCVVANPGVPVVQCSIDMEDFYPKVRLRAKDAPVILLVIYLPLDSFESWREGEPIGIGSDTEILGPTLQMKVPYEAIEEDSEGVKWVRVFVLRGWDTFGLQTMPSIAHSISKSAAVLLNKHAPPGTLVNGEAPHRVKMYIDDITMVEVEVGVRPVTAKQCLHNVVYRLLRPDAIKVEKNQPWGQRNHLHRVRLRVLREWS